MDNNIHTCHVGFHVDFKVTEDVLGCDPKLPSSKPKVGAGDTLHQWEIKDSQEPSWPNCFCVNMPLEWSNLYMLTISWNSQFKVDLEDMQLKMFQSYLNFSPNSKCEVPIAHFGHIETSIYPSWFCTTFYRMKAFLKNLLWFCLMPHDCGDVGPQLTCHTCFQCLTYSSLKCKHGKSMTLLVLKPSLIYLCNSGHILCAYSSYYASTCYCPNLGWSIHKLILEVIYEWEWERAD